MCGVHILPSWPLRSAQRQRTQPELKRLDPSVETAGYKSHVSIGLQRCVNLDLPGARLGGEAA